MKRVIPIILIVSTLLLTACHEHTWTDATCTQPTICEKCGETAGSPLEHRWVEATCTTAKTCEVCGETEGEMLGHTWLNATCTVPKVCEICKKTDGEPSGHTWLDATCTSPQICEKCGEINGNILSHNYSSGYCEKCGTKDPDYVNLNEFGFNNNYGMNIWLEICAYDYSKNMVRTYKYPKLVFYSSNYRQLGKIDSEDLNTKTDINIGLIKYVSTEPYDILSNNAIQYDSADCGWGTVTVLERVTDSDNKKLVIKTQNEAIYENSVEEWFAPVELLDFSTITETVEDGYTYYWISFK